METASLINRIMIDSKPAVPSIGDGATILHWTDREAATVIAVSASGKTITIQTDRAIRTDAHGMSDVQNYRYVCDPDGAIYTVRLGKKGWKILGGHRVSVGHRSAYHDFSF